MRAPKRARVLRRKKKKKREERKRKEKRKKERKKKKRWCSTSSRDEDGTAPPLPVYSTCLVVSNSKIPSTVVYLAFSFFLSLPYKTHLRYCLSALSNGGEGDTSKEEKDWDGKYEGGYESR